MKASSCLRPAACARLAATSALPRRVANPSRTAFTSRPSLAGQFCGSKLSLPGSAARSVLVTKISASSGWDAQVCTGVRHCRASFSVCLSGDLSQLYLATVQRLSRRAQGRDAQLNPIVSPSSWFPWRDIIRVSLTSFINICHHE